MISQMFCRNQTVEVKEKTMTEFDPKTAEDRLAGPHQQLRDLYESISTESLSIVLEICRHIAVLAAMKKLEATLVAYQSECTNNAPDKLR